MPRWSVDIIRKRAERLGTIEAANEKEAIEKAAKEFDIPPERQNRIVVQPCCEPGPVLCAMDLGIGDDGKCAGHKQEAQIAVTSFADTAEPVLAPARVLLRHEADPG